MKTAVLPDDSLTIDAHHFAVRKSLPDDVHSLMVEVGLPVSRHQYGTINDQIVGIGGWKPIALIIDRTGEWQFQEPVGMALQRLELLQFAFHLHKVRMRLVSPYI